LYGLGADNIFSARLVLSTGELLTVSGEENGELVWGLRGVGHSFGVVSELTVKAYPQINEGIHWSGMVTFPGSKEIVEKVSKTIKDVGIGRGIGCTMIWVRMPPDF
jgi:hypothetical protein